MPKIKWTADSPETAAHKKAVAAEFTKLMTVSDISRCYNISREEVREFISRMGVRAICPTGKRRLYLRGEVVEAMEATRV